MGGDEAMRFEISDQDMKNEMTLDHHHWCTSYDDERKRMSSSRNHATNGI